MKQMILLFILLILVSACDRRDNEQHSVIINFINGTNSTLWMKLDGGEKEEITAHSTISKRFIISGSITGITEKVVHLEYGMGNLTFDSIDIHAQMDKQTGFTLGYPHAHLHIHNHTDGIVTANLSATGKFGYTVPPQDSLDIKILIPGPLDSYNSQMIQVHSQGGFLLPQSNTVQITINDTTDVSVNPTAGCFRIYNDSDSLWITQVYLTQDVTHGWGLNRLADYLQKNEFSDFALRPGHWYMKIYDNQAHLHFFEGDAVIPEMLVFHFQENRTATRR